jgi:hypothetical protein
LPCDFARQSLCRANRALCRAICRTATCCFPVVLRLSSRRCQARTTYILAGGDRSNSMRYAGFDGRHLQLVVRTVSDRISHDRALIWRAKLTRARNSAVDGDKGIPSPAGDKGIPSPAGEQGQAWQFWGSHEAMKTNHSDDRP